MTAYDDDKQAPDLDVMTDIVDGDLMVAKQPGDERFKQISAINAKAALETPLIMILDISAGGALDIVDATGYSSTRRNRLLLLIGTIPTNTTVKLDQAYEGRLSVLDNDGNGTSSPELKLELIAFAGDSLLPVQSSDNTPNVIEILDDNEGVDLLGIPNDTTWFRSTSVKAWRRDQGGTLRPTQPGDLEIGTFVTPSSSSAVNFTALGANLTLDNDHIQNDIVQDAVAFNDGNENTDATTPFAVTADVEQGGQEAWRAADANKTTSFWASDTSALPHNWTIDTGAGGITVTGWRWRAHATVTSTNPADFSLQGSDTGVFSGEETVLDTRSSISTGAGAYTTLFPIASPANFRHHRIVITANESGNQTVIVDVDLRISNPATTLNTALTEQLVSSGTISYDPASTVILDENDVALSTGECNLSYDINGAGQTSLIDIAAFKALDVSLFSGADLGSGGLFIRVQPVGLDSIKNVEISNTETTFKLKQSGQFQILQSSVSKFDTIDGDLDLAKGVGLHGKVAPAQANHITDPTDEASLLTAVASILVALENQGTLNDT